LRYPVAALYADYLRVALGLALTAGPLLLLDLAGPVALLLGLVGLLFAWFGARTVIRHLSRVELSAHAIALSGPVSRRLVWTELERMKLAYYAPHRVRADGWMQLTLRGRNGSAIRLDSTLAGFNEVLGAASRAATANSLSLDAATQANLAALGLGAGASPDHTASPLSAPGPGRADAGPRGSRARC
jgi:hypothetical protein